MQVQQTAVRVFAGSVFAVSFGCVGVAAANADTGADSGPSSAAADSDGAVDKGSAAKTGADASSQLDRPAATSTTKKSDAVRADKPAKKPRASRTAPDASANASANASSSADSDAKVAIQTDADTAVGTPKTKTVPANPLVPALSTVNALVGQVTSAVTTAARDPAPPVARRTTATTVPQSDIISTAAAPLNLPLNVPQLNLPTFDAVSTADNPVKSLISVPATLSSAFVSGPGDQLFTAVTDVAISLDSPDFPIVRPAVGLTVDVVSIVSSLVNNVSAEAEVIIPDDLLFGVPDAVAGSLAVVGGHISQVASDSPIGAETTGKFPWDIGVWNLLLALDVTDPPPGADDPDITVTPEHPLPIILLNGTLGTQGDNWGVGAPVLANAGYKVYSFNYGNVTPFPGFPFQGLGNIEESGQELSDEIDRVLAETGAEKVIIVGHSQGGGILPAYYINEMGGADKVSQVIGIAPSNHGTNVDGLVALLSIPVLGQLGYATLNLIGPALTQQLVTSPFQEVVYGNGDTRPGVQYTNIITANDWIVTPYSQQMLDGPNVVNILIQDYDPDFRSGHANIVVSDVTWGIVLDALAANPEANPLAPEHATQAA